MVTVRSQFVVHLTTTDILDKERVLLVASNV
jgi:hypothetical protein